MTLGSEAPLFSRGLRELAGRTLVVLAVTVLILLQAASAESFEVDAIAVFYRIVDGDTFDCFPLGRVRLADVNAPERGEPGYYEATRALGSILAQYERLYLDVDDYYVKDKYNRVIAVVYVRFNETHLLNVNAWLVLNGYAEIVDYPNEFTPQAWSLYVYYPKQMEAESVTTVTVTIEKTITKIVQATRTKTAAVTETELKAKTVQPETVTVTVVPKELKLKITVLVALAVVLALVVGMMVGRRI